MTGYFIQELLSTYCLLSSSSSKIVAVLLTELFPAPFVRKSYVFNKSIQIFGTVIFLMLVQIATAQTGNIKVRTKTETIRKSNPAGKSIRVIADSASLTPFGIQNGPPLSASITKTNLACPGDANGSITATGNGGVPGYQYSIDLGQNFQTSGTFNNLSAGDYTITVQDDNNQIYDTVVTMGIFEASWLGTISSDWHTPGNWSTGLVPDAATHVIIPTTAVNGCNITSQNGIAASMRIRPSGIFYIVNSRQLLISGRCPSF